MKNLRVPIYGGQLLLCTQRDEYTKARARYEEDDGESLKDCFGISEKCADKKQRVVYLIGVFEGGKQTLVHELAHTTFEILRHASVPISARSDEAFAYLIDCLYEKCAPFVTEERR